MALNEELREILDVAYGEPKKYAPETVSKIRQTAGQMAHYLLFSDKNHKKYDSGIFVSIEKYKKDGRYAYIITSALNDAGFSGNVMDNAAKILMIEPDLESGSNDKVSMPEFFNLNDYLRQRSHYISRDGVMLYLRDKWPNPFIRLTKESDYSLDLPNILKALKECSIDERYDFVLGLPDEDRVIGYFESGDVCLDEDFINSKKNELLKKMMPENELINKSLSVLREYDLLREYDSGVTGNVDSYIGQKNDRFDQWFDHHYRSMNEPLKSITHSTDGEPDLIITFPNSKKRMTICMKSPVAYELFNELDAALGLLQ